MGKPTDPCRCSRVCIPGFRGTLPDDTATAKSWRARERRMARRGMAAITRPAGPPVGLPRNVLERLEQRRNSSNSARAAGRWREAARAREPRPDVASPSSTACISPTMSRFMSTPAGNPSAGCAAGGALRTSATSPSFRRDRGSARSPRSCIPRNGAASSTMRSFGDMLISASCEPAAIAAPRSPATPGWRCPRPGAPCRRRAPRRGRCGAAR